MLKSYKDLKVWQKAYKLGLEIYQITGKFPKQELYSLTTQLRRSAVSIPSIIAEGSGRKTTADYLRFLYIEHGSCCELETQVMLSGDLGYIPKPVINALQENFAEIERMLMALIRSLEKKCLKSLNP